MLSTAMWILLITADCGHRKEETYSLMREPCFEILSVVNILGSMLELGTVVPVVYLPRSLLLYTHGVYRLRSKTYYDRALPLSTL